MEDRENAVEAKKGCQDSGGSYIEDRASELALVLALEKKAHLIYRIAR